MTVSSGFLKHRARVLGLNDEEKEEKIKQEFSRLGKGFLENRQQVLSTATRKSPPKKQVIQDEKPIVKEEDEPGGIIQGITDIVRTVTQEVVKHFEEKAPITALLQGKPQEALSRLDRTVRESNLARLTPEIDSQTGKIKRESVEGAIEGVMDFATLGVGTITKKSFEAIAKATDPKTIKTILNTEIFKNAPDDLVNEIAKRFSKINDPKVIQNELDEFKKISDQKIPLEKQVDVLDEGSLIHDQRTLLEKAPKAKTPETEVPAGLDLSGQPLQSSSQKRGLPQSQEGLELQSQTSNRLYNEDPKITKAIEETAKTIKEPVSKVKNVVNAVQEMKVKTLEFVQNEQERVRQLVNRKDVVVDDVSDPYLKATLYPGRVATKIQEGKNEAEAIIKEAAKMADEFKTDLQSARKEINDYLHFKHAPERNAALGEKAAGVTTRAATKGLKKIENSPQGSKIKELAERASRLNEQTLDLLKNSGVISDELYSTLRTKYKNHVPLNRIFEETNDIGSVISGKGFDVRSSGIKKAKGSERQVDDILENIVVNYEQAVLRSEKNIVDQATLTFVRNNKDTLGHLFEIKKPKAIGKTFDGKMIMESTTDPTILQLFENGKPVWIKINDKNLAIALKSVGREKVPVYLRAVASFTRLYSGLATRFNPEFALPNKIRDLQETAVYLASQKEIGFKGAAKTVTKDVLQQNTKAVLDSIRGVDSEGARLYRELQEMGGTTGGFGLSTKKNVSLDIEKMEKLATSKTKRVADNLIEYVDHWNTIFEDSTRLSVYRQALEQNLSKERAAFLAKEASINFNRMGKGGPVINALYMFSNASIQGSVKMIRSLKNPRVLGATMLAVGSSVAAINEWNDRIDPEWRDKVTKWDRMNGLPLVLPNQDGEGVKYITIPVSWGIKPIKVMADYAYDTLSGYEFDIKKFMEDSTTAILEAYNPVGGADLMSAVTPTVGDIPLELSRNQSWSGAKIRPDFDQNAPSDIQYFQSQRETKTGQVAISISEILQSRAEISISPANIKYAFEGYAGGVGRAGSKIVNTILGAFSDSPAPVDEYPILSRFYRERTEEEVGSGSGGDTEDIKRLLEEQSRERFKIKEEAEKTFEDLSKLPKEEANTRAREIKKENPELFDKLRDIKEEKELGLNYTERLMKQLGVENGERAKYVFTQVSKLKTREEKNEYIRNLKQKKVISDRVFEQLKILLKK